MKPNEKSIEFGAVRFGTSPKEIKELKKFVGDSLGRIENLNHPTLTPTVLVICLTDSGEVTRTARKGDWILKNEQGYDVCDNEKFENLSGHVKGLSPNRIHIKSPPSNFSLKIKRVFRQIIGWDFLEVFLYGILPLAGLFILISGLLGSLSYFEGEEKDSLLMFTCEELESGKISGDGEEGRFVVDQFPNHKINRSLLSDAMIKKGCIINGPDDKYHYKSYDE